jgi:diguanylate cyclase (GGDEF)-like protein
MGVSRSDWRFGPKILVPMTGIAIAAILLMIFGLYWTTSRSNAISIERQVRTTQRAFDDSVARLALEQETVAVWDETATRLSQPDPDMGWIHDNVGLWLNKVFGHDRTYIVDGRDRPIYASIDGHRVPAAGFEAIRADLRYMIDEARGRRRTPSNKFDRHPNWARPGADVLTTERAIHDTELASVAGRPASVSVMRIRASTPALQPPGIEPLMISIRFLDGRFLQELQDRNLIEGARFSRDGRRDPGEQALPLDSERHDRIGYLVWQPEQPGSRIMMVLAPITTLMILAMVTLMGGLLWWLRRSTDELRDTLVQLRASEAQAQHLAYHDTLTGLPNRALFNERLDHALAAIGDGSSGDRQIALLMLDLDRFKNVNDTLGHLIGDGLIRQFGARIAALLGDGDIVARLGGDEFAVLLTGIAGRADAELACARILEAVRSPFQILGSAVFARASIGFVCAPEAGRDRMELIRRADIALYRAKAEGRDGFRMFRADMDEHVQFQNAIEEDLRAALGGSEQLCVLYQPEMNPDGVTVVGLEALVRWQHPERGPIPPDQFIPIAEDSGQISLLGEWVLLQACRVARRWPHLFVAVNLSPAQFHGANIVDRLAAIVRAAGVSPSQIELEVTEGVLLEQDDLVQAVMSGLRAAGFRIALDDFGTGYSSLSYLRRFAVDKIKIDRSFVEQIGHEVDSASLIEALVRIGETMGLTVTAEGVETEAQRRYLVEIGCHQMQGFLFSEALAEADLPAVLGAQVAVHETIAALPRPTASGR